MKLFLKVFQLLAVGDRIPDHKHHHLWSPIPVWEGHRDFFCVPLCMVARDIMLMLSLITIDIYCRELYDDMTVVVCI